MRISKVKGSEEIAERVKNNDGYCPCRLIKTKDTKCMCKDFVDQFEKGEPGVCHCGLYEITND